MKITQKNDAGEEVEVEVFSPEEVSVKIEEAQKERDALAAKVDDTKEDHPNFKSLKEALKKKDDDFKKLEEEVSTDKAQRQSDAMDIKIKGVSKGDEEIEKKIKLNLTSTLSGMPESTEADRTAKFNAAVKLSAEYASEQPGLLDNAMANGSSAGSPITDGDSSVVNFTEREKALGNKMGISDEDRKKYGPRLVNKINK